MFKQVININDLKSIITAVEHLQECGKLDDAKRLLADLANDIKTALEKKE